MRFSNTAGDYWKNLDRISDTHSRFEKILKAAAEKIGKALTDEQIVDALNKNRDEWTKPLTLIDRKKSRLTLRPRFRLAVDPASNQYVRQPNFISCRVLYSDPEQNHYEAAFNFRLHNDGRLEQIAEEEFICTNGYEERCQQYKEAHLLKRANAAVTDEMIRKAYEPHLPDPHQPLTINRETVKMEAEFYKERGDIIDVTLVPQNTYPFYKEHLYFHVARDGNLQQLFKNGDILTFEPPSNL